MSHCCMNHCCRPRRRRRVAPVGGIRINRGVLLVILFLLIGRTLTGAGANTNVNVINVGSEDVDDFEDDCC
jgi:hypothetical protein